MNKLPIILEYIWLGLSVFCVALGIHAIVKVGNTSQVSTTFFILAILALLMFFIRRKRRINANK